MTSERLDSLITTLEEAQCYLVPHTETRDEIATAFGLIAEVLTELDLVAHPLTERPR